MAGNVGVSTARMGDSGIVGTGMVGSDICRYLVQRRPYQMRFSAAARAPLQTDERDVCDQRLL